MKTINRRGVFSMVAGLFGAGVAMARQNKQNTGYVPYEIGLSRYDQLIQAEKEMLSLRTRLSAALQYFSDVVPTGKVIVFYPCGCYSGVEINNRVGVLVGEPNTLSIPRNFLFCSKHDRSARKINECDIVFGKRISSDPAFVFNKDCFAMVSPRVKL